MAKSISVLGSTGSIGTQALDVARKLNLNIVALTANSNIKLLEDQVRQFQPEIAVVYNEAKAGQLKHNIKDTNTKVFSGKEGLIQAAVCKNADMVLNSLVGMVGLEPTLEAINAKKDIALANKETLVAGGKLVMEAARKNGVSIYPVDSEHSAVFQCLQGCNQKEELKRIILTASGGPFFGRTLEQLKTVTVQQALNHPNWDMGSKITIDSATMMNKGLEIIEAAWLFDLPAEQIDVVVHRESIIHSLVEYIDNSVIAQLGVPDMRIPIQYAVTYPARVPSPVKQLDLTELSQLTFYKPDYDNFLCLKACKEAIEKGGLAPAAANGANELANKLFLEGKLSFLQIGELVYGAMQAQKAKEPETLQDVLQADAEARQYVRDHVS